MIFRTKVVDQASASPLMMQSSGGGGRRHSLTGIQEMFIHSLVSRFKLSSPTYKAPVSLFLEEDCAGSVDNGMNGMCSGDNGQGLRDAESVRPVIIRAIIMPENNSSCCNQIQREQRVFNNMLELVRSINEEKVEFFFQAQLLLGFREGGMPQGNIGMIREKLAELRVEYLNIVTDECCLRAVDMEGISGTGAICTDL